MNIDQIKVLTRMGLLMMEERKTRLDAVMEGYTIHTPELVRLIDDCMDNCYAMTERESSVTDYEITQIRWMIQGIKGAEVVKCMEPEEIVEWVLDLKKTKFTKRELRTVGKAIMKRQL